MVQRMKGLRGESTEQGGSDEQVFGFVGIGSDQQMAMVGRVEAVQFTSRKDAAQSRQSDLVEAMEPRDHTLGEAVEHQKVEELDVRRNGVGMGGDEPEAGDEESVWYPLARAISLVLHPIMIPTYVLLVMLYGQSALALFSPQAKFYLLLMSIVNTVVIPFLLIMLMKTTLYSRIFSPKMKRVFTILAIACCYLMNFLALSDPIFTLVRLLFIVSFVCAMFAFVVSYFWSVSTHMIAAMAGISFLFALHFFGIANLTAELVIALLLAGMVGSARLLLGRENLPQVSIGAVSGVVVAVAVMMIKL